MALGVVVDVKDWPTKQETAAQLGVSAGSIDRLLRQRRLKKRIRHGTGLPIVVIDPESIAEFRRGTADPGAVSPRASVALTRVVRPSPPPPAPAPARSSVAPSGLEAAFLAFLQSKIPAAVVPVERRIFLNMAESAEFSGLPAAFLRKLIASGKLKALKTGSGWRVSRAELEKLSGTLTEAPQDMTEQQLRDLELNRLRRQGLA